MPQNTAIWAAPPRMPNRAKNAPSPLGRGCPGRAALTRAPTPRETEGQREPADTAQGEHQGEPAEGDPDRARARAYRIRRSVPGEGG
jgi:hypothetical protein